MQDMKIKAFGWSDINVNVKKEEDKKQNQVKHKRMVP